MPDFGRWSANGGDPSLNEINRTDRFLDALARGGVAAGLSEREARKLAVETVFGSAALAAQSAESFEQLRKNVTSPGGTTERALAVLMAADAWPTALSRAIAAATARSRELAG